jgi:hypothetical protein
MLNIKYNFEASVMKHFEIGTGVSLVAGEWAIFNAATGKLEKQAGAYDITKGKAFPVFGGTARLDSKALASAVICLGSGFVAETDLFAAETIKPGDLLTIADGVLTKAVVAGTVTNPETGAIGVQTDRALYVAVATSSNAAGVLEFRVL